MNQDETTASQAKTSQLVEDIVAKLRSDDKVDSALVEILTENIVKLYPAENAVTDAVKAMEALATKRAEELDDDLADHD